MKRKQNKPFAEVCYDLKANDPNTWPSGSIAAWHKRAEILFDMAPGKHRRAAVVRLLQAGVQVRVDCKHSIQIKNDRDMQKLIKDEVIEIYTRRVWWNCTQKYLRLKRGVPQQ